MNKGILSIYVNLGDKDLNLPPYLDKNKGDSGFFAPKKLK